MDVYVHTKNFVDVNSCNYPRCRAAPLQRSYNMMGLES